MDANQSPVKLPRVQENVLRKRRQNLEAKRRGAVKALKRKRALKNYRKTHFVRLEKIVQRHKKALRNAKRVKRQAVKPESCKQTIKGDLAVVVRIRGPKDVPEHITTLLKLFRLKGMNDAVFVKMNKATNDLLSILDLYVTWGYPNLRTVRDLIFKRGSAKSRTGRKQLSDNTIVEKELGKYDIICIEDLVHEIFSVTPNFKRVNNFLDHFTLNAPQGGWRKLNKHFKDGGDFGCRNDEINTLLKAMI